MPYVVTWEKPAGLCVSFSGQLTPEDVRAANEELAKDPRFDDARYAIADCSGVVGHAFDLSDANQVVEPHVQLFGAVLSNPRLRAVMVVPDPAVRMLVQRAVQLGWPFPTVMVDTLQDAHDWVASQTLRLRMAR